MSYEGLVMTDGDINASHVGGNIIEGDPHTFSPKAWNYLISRFALKSVMDLGSGRGYAARYFYKQGIEVLAVDGMKENCYAAIYPTVHIDLSLDKVETRVDLVHCVEVVEHISEEYLDNLLASLACGRFIVMTNALPGQGGHHHVNEQPTEYWIDHLKRYNCEVLVEDTQRIKNFAKEDGAWYLSQSGMVLANRSFR
jgi:hypothetical protein